MKQALSLFVALVTVMGTQAFVIPRGPLMPRSSRGVMPVAEALPVGPVLVRDLVRPVARTTMAPMYGLFGLGTPELIVIAVVAGVVLGPDKIVDLARGIGKAAGELKAVPQEFEKGLKNGEESAKAAVAVKKQRGAAKELENEVEA